MANEIMFPNRPNHHHHDPHQPHSLATARTTTTFSSLPDDLILECLSRATLSSLPSLSSVSRRFSLLLNSATFSRLRRQYILLRHSIISIYASDSSLLVASLRINDDDSKGDSWKRNSLFDLDYLPSGSFSHARVVAIGRMIYILGQNFTVRFDAWTGMFYRRSAMSFQRKEFAASVVNGKIYVTGGISTTTSTVEEYDPENDEWRVVSNDAPRRGYGCVGSSAEGIFYVIGGLKIGSEDEYESSMDLYDVEARHWLKSRSIPDGGYVVAGCAAEGHVYVLSHDTASLSLWRFDGRRKSSRFGEWCRIKTPPLPGLDLDLYLDLDNTIGFSCVAVGEKIVLIQVKAKRYFQRRAPRPRFRPLTFNQFLERINRCFQIIMREGPRDGSLALVYDSVGDEWTRVADLPEEVQHAACVCVEC